MVSLFEQLPENIKRVASIVNKEDGTPQYIQLLDGRRLKPWTFGREERKDTPYVVHCSGGLPHVVATHFEVWHEGGGWDLPTLMFLDEAKENAVTLRQDFYLIPAADQKMLLKKYNYSKGK